MRRPAVSRRVISLSGRSTVEGWSKGRIAGTRVADRQAALDEHPYCYALPSQAPSSWLDGRELLGGRNVSQPSRPRRVGLLRLEARLQGRSERQMHQSWPPASISPAGGERATVAGAMSTRLGRRSGDSPKGSGDRADEKLEALVGRRTTRPSVDDFLLESPAPASSRALASLPLRRRRRHRHHLPPPLRKRLVMADPSPGAPVAGREPIESPESRPD